VNVAVSKGGRRGLWALFWLFVVFLYAPILVLIVFSFNDRETVSFPWQGATLRWYRQFLENTTLLEALRTSALIALLTAILTTILAIPATIVLVRRRFLGRPFVMGMLLAPLVIPLVVLGIALLVLFNWFEVPLSPLTVVVGHIVIALPFAILTLVPRLERIPRSYEEASRDLGANALTAFRTVTLPLLAPAVVSALLISFVISFDEVVVASFIAGEATTFPLYLFSQLRLPRSLPQVIAVAVVVMVTSFVVVVASEVWRRVADRRLEAQLGVAAADLAGLGGGTKGAA
jgi:spermidine/putrescine transport system permease protein